MKKIGFIVRDLGQSELNYFLIRGANHLIANQPGLSVTAFYETMASPCLPMNFASMGVFEAYGFDGALVATSFATAQKLICIPSAKKFFFVNDLEWLRGRGKVFREQLQVYGHPELTILVRSEEHGQAYSQLWNRPVKVVGHFDVHTMMEATR